MASQYAQSLPADLDNLSPLRDTPLRDVARVGYNIIIFIVEIISTVKIYSYNDIVSTETWHMTSSRKYFPEVRPIVWIISILSEAYA